MCLSCFLQLVIILPFCETPAALVDLFDKNKHWLEGEKEKMNKDAHGVEDDANKLGSDLKQGRRDTEMASKY